MKNDNRHCKQYIIIVIVIIVLHYNFIGFLSNWGPPVRSGARGKAGLSAGLGSVIHAIINPDGLFCRTNEG